MEALRHRCLNDKSFDSDNVTDDEWFMVVEFLFPYAVAKIDKLLSMFGGESLPGELDDVLVHLRKAAMTYVSYDSVKKEDFGQFDGQMSVVLEGLIANAEAESLVSDDDSLSSSGYSSGSLECTLESNKSFDESYKLHSDEEETDSPTLAKTGYSLFNQAFSDPLRDFEFRRENSASTTAKKNTGKSRP